MGKHWVRNKYRVPEKEGGGQRGERKGVGRRGAVAYASHGRAARVAGGQSAWALGRGGAGRLLDHVLRQPPSRQGGPLPPLPNDRRHRRRGQALRGRGIALISRGGGGRKGSPTTGYKRINTPNITPFITPPSGRPTKRLINPRGRKTKDTRALSFCRKKPKNSFWVIFMWQPSSKMPFLTSQIAKKKMPIWGVWGSFWSRSFTKKKSLV